MSCSVLLTLCSLQTLNGSVYLFTTKFSCCRDQRGCEPLELQSQEVVSHLFSHRLHSQAGPTNVVLIDLGVIDPNSMAHSRRLTSAGGRTQLALF